MSPAGKDLARHMSEQVNELVMRHMAVAKLALPTDEIMLLMVHTGIDMLCSAVASTVATSQNADSAEQIAEDMAVALGRMLHAAMPDVVAKARAAISAQSRGA